MRRAVLVGVDAHSAVTLAAVLPFCGNGSGVAYLAAIRAFQRLPRPPITLGENDPRSSLFNCGRSAEHSGGPLLWGGLVRQPGKSGETIQKGAPPRVGVQQGSCRRKEITEARGVKCGDGIQGPAIRQEVREDEQMKSGGIHVGRVRLPKPCRHQWRTPDHQQHAEARQNRTQRRIRDPRPRRRRAPRVRLLQKATGCCDVRAKSPPQRPQNPVAGAPRGLERKLQIKWKPQPRPMLPAPPPALKTYSVHFLRTEVLNFEALEVRIESQDGLLAFYGQVKELLYLIPIDSVKYIRVKEAARADHAANGFGGANHSTLGLPEWMAGPAPKSGARNS